MIGVTYFEKAEYFSGLRSHIEKADKAFPSNDVAAICLKGSQNYGLDTEDSDFDSRALVLPSFDDIAFNRKNLSGTIILEKGEHLGYKDVRDYLDELRKQSITSIELLFSSAYIYSSSYEKEWKTLIDNREKIARMNPYRLVKSAVGMARGHYNKYCNSGNVKFLYHVVRLCDFIERYIANVEPYKDILKPLNADFILSIKKGEIGKEECDKTAKEKMEYIEAISDSYLRTMIDKCDDEVLQILNEVQKTLILRALYFEIGGLF